MAELGPDIVAEVVAACTAGASVAGSVLSTALDTTLEVSVGEAGQFDAAAPPEGFDGAALVVVIRAEGKGAALVLPATSGLVPDWCEAPEEKEKSKLAALSEGLCEPLFGETVFIDFFEAAHVANVGEALSRGELLEAAPLLPLELKVGEDQTTTASLLWPLAKPAEFFAAAETADEEEEASTEAEPEPASEPAAAQVESPAESPATPAAPPRRGELPPYTKSLLRIKIPLSATLANSKQKVEDIISMGPGAILQFDKGCDELLELHAGDHLIARGEAVKVGDKFGLQIKTIELPEERFKKLG